MPPRAAGPQPGPSPVIRGRPGLANPADAHTSGALARNALLGKHSWQAGRHVTSAPCMPSASPLPDDKESPMVPFTQLLDPTHSLAGSTLLALVPVATLLLLLAVFRMTAWRAVIIGSAVTLILAVTVWNAPVGNSLAAYGLGAATGIWSVDWIVFWGVIIYNTMVVTGTFEDFKRWLIRQATADIRVQTHAHGLGARCPAGRARRVRVSLGRRRPHPHRARGGRPGGDQGRRAREQRARLVRRPGRSGHRPGRGDQPAAAVALGLDRQDRRDPRAAAALDPDLPRQRQARAARRLAAGHCRLAGLYRWAVPDRRVRRPVPA